MIQTLEKYKLNENIIREYKLIKQIFKLFHKPFGHVRLLSLVSPVFRQDDRESFIFIVNVVIFVIFVRLC